MHHTTLVPILGCAVALAVCTALSLAALAQTDARSERKIINLETAKTGTSDVDEGQALSYPALFINGLRRACLCRARARTAPPFLHLPSGGVQAPALQNLRSQAQYATKSLRRLMDLPQWVTPLGCIEELV